MTAQDLQHVRPWRAIQRRPSRKIRVGSVEVGGDAPISVQSMTNTLTADAEATIGQVRALEEAGADIVRVSCPDEESTAALPAIVAETVRLLNPGGVILAQKGKLPQEEIQALEQVTVEVFPLAVPGVDAARHLIAIQLRDQ